VVKFYAHDYGTKMKRIFGVRADQGLEPEVVYMVIQWECLAKCQGNRKGGLEFSAHFSRRHCSCLVIIRAKISRLQHFVRFASKTELFAIIPTNFPRSFLKVGSSMRYETRNKKR